jgi:hypothetical protein
VSVLSRQRDARSPGALAAGALLALSTGACGGAVSVPARQASGASSNRSPAGSPPATPTSAAEGQSTTATVTSVIPPGQRLRGDGDADNPSDIDGNGDRDTATAGGSDSDNDSPTPASYDFPDGDDRAALVYGRPPSAAARRAIATVVRRYYAAASVDDGATACALLLPGIARSVPEDYGRAGRGPPYLRGASTCQSGLAMLFEHFHGELTGAVDVVRVGVRGGTARAVLSSRTMPASSAFLTRQDGSWKLLGLLAQPLP